MTFLPYLLGFLACLLLLAALTTCFDAGDAGAGESFHNTRRKLWLSIALAYAAGGMFFAAGVLR